MTEIIFLSSKSSNNAFVFPLYLYPTEKERAFGATERVSNFSDEFIEDFAKRLQLSFIEDGRGDLRETFGEEDVFHYIYAVLHSPTYRTRYAEFLKIDFPRIPLTTDAALFRRLTSAGADLVALHLLEDDYAAARWNDGDGAKQNPLSKPIAHYTGFLNDVAKGFPKYENGAVYINKSSRFDGVPEEVWNFHIGGYQVAHKWLKDRRERTLSQDDIQHYARVMTALNETIRLMTEIDAIIEEHGGFPLVGSQ